MMMCELIARYIIKQMQENCWVMSLSFSLLNLFQTFSFMECSWFVTKKKWSKYRPKYFWSWYRSRESTLILAAMVWRESQRESIRWFASKSRPWRSALPWWFLNNFSILNWKLSLLACHNLFLPKRWYFAIFSKKKKKKKKKKPF